MKCSKCGAELSDDTRFCSYCGEKIEVNSSDSVDNGVSESDHEETNNQTTFLPEKEKKSIADNIKDRGVGFWNKLSSYEKVTTVALIVFTLMCLIAFIAGKIFAGIIALLSIALTVVALLMKKQIIKPPKSWIHIVALAIAIVLIVPYFSLFGGNGNSSTDKGEKFSWSNLILEEVIPQPKSDVGKIITNTESSLSVYIYKTSTDDFCDYIKACKDKGFTVDAEQLTSSFNAYNESGYKLSLYYAESNKEMHIGVDAPVVYGELKWSDNGLGKLLPTPVSKVGEVKKDDDKGFEAIVAETSIEDFKAYAKLCSDKGFSIDIKESDKSFNAKNADGYKLSVKYIGNNVMSISIDEPEYQVTVEVECVENWIFSKYDVDVYVDDSLEGTLSHGTTDTYSVTLTKGTYTIKFVSAEDDGVTGTVKIDISKDEDIKLKISCYSDKISVETISGTLSNNNENTESSTSESSKITVTMSEDDFKGMNYEDAEKKFREMGFTTFEYKTVDTENESAADTICYIEITEFFIGDSDFVKGDKFDADSTITFYSYKYEEPEAPKPVFYSTNDYETAKKGNTGVFSYRDRSGSYDIYWIIDFNEGYVYYFTDGNGDTTCDKVKIVSGDLNDKIIITYHDGSDVWSYGLHFKYVNHPETLIMQDNDGFEYKYSTTDLDDALKLRNTKTIHEY